jgi:hypothetical protein
VIHPIFDYLLNYKKRNISYPLSPWEELHISRTKGKKGTLTTLELTAAILRGREFNGV